MKAFLYLLVILLSPFTHVFGQETDKDRFVGNVLESNPEYPGGLEKFYEFVYEKKPKSSKTEGRVFVSFFVEPDGKVTEIKMIKGISSDFDNKLLAALQKMPTWTPAKLKGEAIRKKMVIHIDY